MRIRRIIKAVSVLLILFTGFLILLILTINLPAFHNYVTRKVNNIFKSSQLPIHISSLSGVLPWKVSARDVLISGPQGDTIVYAANVSSGIRPLALLRRKLKLKSVDLSNARINICRYRGEAQLNIVSAFSGGGEAEPAEGKGKKNSLDISIADGSLHHLSFVMNDSAGGIFVRQDIGLIKFVTRKMSLIKHTLVAKTLRIEEATGSVVLTKSESEEASEPGSQWNIGIEDFTADRVNFIFDDKANRQKLDLLGSEIEFRARKTDLTGKVLDIRQISVSKTSAVLYLDKTADQVTSKTTETGPFDWDINCGKIIFQDVSLQMLKYSDTAEYDKLSGYSVIGMGMNLSELTVNRTIMKAALRDVRFDLGNGFSVKNMKLNLDSRPGSALIDVDLQTGNSRLVLEGLADGDLQGIISDPAELRNAHLTLQRSEISAADLFYFRPELKKIALSGLLEKSPFKVKGRLDLAGTAATLTSLSIAQIPGFRAEVSGTIGNVINLRNSTCNLKTVIGEADTIWLKGVMQAIAPGLYIPDFKSFDLQASVSDSLMTPRFDMRFKSDLGSLELNGSLNLHSDRFSMKASIYDVNAGKILKNDIGAISGNAVVSGGGINAKAIEAEGTLVIDSLRYRDYQYAGLKLRGSMHPGRSELRLTLDDPSVMLNMSADLTFADSLLTVRTDGSFHADLFRLHISGDSLTAGAKFRANLRKSDDGIESEASLTGINFTSPGNSGEISLIRASLNSDSLRTDISSASDFHSAEVHFKGSVQTLGTFIRDYTEYLGSLIDPVKSDSSAQTMIFPSITARMDIVYNSALRKILPDTSVYFKKIHLDAATNQQNNSIKYTLTGTGLNWGLLRTENLYGSLSDSAGAFGLNIRADSCLIGTQPEGNIRIKSHFTNWQSLTSVSAAGRQDSALYNFEISSEIQGDSIVLKIPSGQLILNGLKWQAERKEFMRVKLKSGGFSPSLIMHSDSSVISFLREGPEEQQKYTLSLAKVKLSSFLKPELLPGSPDFEISGSAEYGDHEGSGTRLKAGFLISDARWYDLHYKKITLTSNLDSDSTGNFDFELRCKLDTSLIEVKGKKADDGIRKINARFNLIPINTVQPFVSKYLADLQGNISGDFNLNTGKMTNDLTGKLSIKNGRLRIIALNSTYSLPDNTLIFDGKKMEFREFKVLDSLNNELRVDGSIDIGNKNQILADLDISSSNLQIMNRKEEKNTTFYGNVFIDSKLTVKGPVASPVLKGKIVLAKGTDVYFRQSEDLSIPVNSGIVSFVSLTTPAGGSRKTVGSPARIYNKSSIESEVVIDPETKININIARKMFSLDMAVKGGGHLNYNMLVNSQVNLSGRYEISEGTASLKMVGWPNKAFRLAKGGYILWDGKLDDPELNLEAINRVRSSYVNPADKKERFVDFDVTLKISDKLSAMNVQFKISTTDQYLMSIINAMSPEEQMRQAITILLFEYIDIPGISVSSSYISEQVNQMVAAQLNSITKTTIKGIDISFGIGTYTRGTVTGAQQTTTSLSYEVKKKLFNDRAKVEISGIVSEQGNQTSNSNTSLNNFSFEYRLDSAATKFLKVYNEHTYEDVFEGEVTKTGIGFTYRKSYPTFGDIWRRERKKNIQNPGNK